MDYLDDSERFDLELDFSEISFPEKEKADIAMIYDKLEENIRNRIMDGLYMGEFLFLINNQTIENLSFSNENNFKVRSFGFDGFLTKYDLQENPNKPKILRDWGIKIGDNEYFVESDLYIYFKLTSNSDDVLQDFLRKFPYTCSFDKRSDDLVFVDFDIDININDLIILDKDLIKLEEKIINNAPIPIKINAELKPRKGVSIQKLQAKEQAKVIAKALWNNDKEQKIRIKEMAGIVYSELHDNGYERQLPNNPDSLQDWIKDIAPPHATIGGRPKNES